ncbi:N-formylglutamate amidohydrolase [Flavobacteriaceae bacterium]|jgi:N-formylglutamate amidohydrolase|nr:N-formylglutamate amidohydrolase [Flavobacteriaceae bacterium]|tara:strand:+ start:483 stop:1226 length:744 start_codon:yes stop_codon:yes gene_type:complete
MKKIILHIPHSAKKVPIKRGFVISQERIDNEILKLTDWHTEDLYNSKNCESIIFEYSRVFCDPERFSDDSKEPMAKVGMGVLYDKTDDNEVMRIISPVLRKKILSEYYFKHHSKLNNMVKKQLELNGRALILDCHSFPEIPMKRSQHKIVPRPDYNIGTDKFHTPKKLIDISLKFFEERNLTLGVDYPFSGSIVPMEYYQKNKNVESIMLEINRKLYLKEGTNEKSDNYKKTKEIVQKYIELIKNEL